MTSWIEQHLAANELTAGQRRILRHIERQPGDFLMVSVKEFAARAGVSPASVTRCVRALGFEGYEAFQKAMKDQLLAAHTLTNAYNYLDPDLADVQRENKLLAAEQQALQDCLHALDADILQDAAQATADAERVYLLGYGSSAVLMHFLQYRFERLGLTVHNLENATQLNILAERCVHMRKRDMIIVSSFRGIYVNIEHLLRYANAFRIPSLAFTENDDSHISTLARWRLPIRRAAMQGFKSLAAPMSVMHLFAMDVAKASPLATESITRRLEWFAKYQQDLKQRDP